MKKILLSFVLLALTQQMFGAFDSLFFNRSLRMDYLHAGDAQHETFYFKELISEPHWAGSHTQLIDTFNYGNHRVELIDQATGRLMYSRGYSSLFAEWQTTAEAEHIRRSYEETVVVPFPRKPAIVRLLSRNYDGVFETKLEVVANPADYFIRPSGAAAFPVHDILLNADPAHAVDIVLIPDGFTAAQMDAFLQSAQDFAEHLFHFEPFASLKAKFNIRAVAAPSADSGVAIPAIGFWPETVVSSSFYTFDSERYCMTHAHHRLRDVAGLAPYDQIYILTNTTKYGGGGIFNFYCLSSALNQSSPQIIVHEFGHGFAGLADEYYDSSTSYESFYILSIEPWEPNITTLVDFSGKWQDLLDADTPVPTPDSTEWEGITGVYEGGGYTAKGVYRPSRDCLMHTFKGEIFCAACNRAIIRMIDFYTR